MIAGLLLAIIFICSVAIVAIICWQILKLERRVDALEAKDEP